MRDQLELAMEALEEENKQLREKVKLLEEVCDIAQADVKTLDKMNDRLHGELEDLHQALHDATADKLRSLRGCGTHLQLATQEYSRR